MKVYKNYLHPRIGTVEVVLGDLPLPAPNPLPVLTQLGQTFVLIGSGDQGIAATGSGFVGSSIAYADGAPLDTEYVSSTALIVTIPASIVAVNGSKAITVVNVGPGGGTSNILTFQVRYTVPVLTSVSPPGGTVGVGLQSRTLTGTDFYTTSIAYVDGAPVTTTYVSATQLTALVPSTTPGTKAITVATAGLGGGTSAAVSYDVTYAPPVFNTLSPNTGLQLVGDLVVTLDGTGFYTNSVVKAGATVLASTYVSATRLTATIPAAMMVSVGTLALTVTNLTPGGGVSAAQNFSVTFAFAAPSVASMSSTTGGLFSGPKAGVVFAGTGFAVGQTTLEDGDGNTIPCTVTSSTSLTATLPNTIHWPSATWTLSRIFKVRNPTPGGGLSTTSVSYALTMPTGVACWFRSDQCTLSGSFVTQLLDLSGGGHHTTVATGTARPTYVASDRGGKPAILWDGVASDLRFTLTTVTPWSWYLSHTPVTRAAANQYFISGVGSPGGGPGCVFTTAAVPTQTGFNSAGGGFPSLQYTRIGRGVTSQIKYNGASSDNIVNGRFGLPALVNAGTGTVTNSAFALGCQFNSATGIAVAGSFMNFKMRELIGGTLTTSELLEYHAYRAFDDYGYAANAKMFHVVCLGDSISNGVGCSAPTNRPISNEAGDKFGLPVNRGTNGATSSDLDINFSNVGSTFSLTPVLDVNYPNVVVMMIGINDAILLFRTRATYLANIQSVRTKFRAWCTANLSTANAALSKFVIVTPTAGKNAVDTAPNQAAAEVLRTGYRDDILADAANWDAVVRPISTFDAVANVGTPYWADDRHLNDLGQGEVMGPIGPVLRTLYAAQGA